MVKLRSSKIFKSVLMSLVFMPFVFNAAASGVSANMSYCYVSNENQLRDAVEIEGNSVFLLNDIGVQRDLHIKKSVKVDLQYHQLYHLDVPSDDLNATVVVGSNQEHINVIIQNGLIWGMSNSCAENGKDSYWGCNGGNGKMGGSAIRLKRAHLYISNVSVYGGCAGNGGCGASARKSIILPGHAGNGGNGGEGGIGIEVHKGGVLNLSTVNVTGGLGGSGGIGGPGYCLKGRYSGSGGHAGNGGCAVYLKDGCLNIVTNVKLFGGNGGDGGAKGYSSDSVYDGADGMAGNGGDGIVYTKDGYMSNLELASIFVGKGGVSSYSCGCFGTNCRYV